MGFLISVTPLLTAIADTFVLGRVPVGVICCIIFTCFIHTLLNTYTLVHSWKFFELPLVSLVRC